MKKGGKVWSFLGGEVFISLGIAILGGLVVATNINQNIDYTVINSLLLASVLFIVLGAFLKYW